MKRTSLYLLLAVLTAAWGSLSAWGDEMDEVLEVEQMMAGETLSAAAENSQAALLADSSVPAAQAVSAASADFDMLSRDELIASLQSAWAEIERMKDIVRRIRDANRREQETMHYNIGCVFRNAGHYRKAEAAFLKALAISPRDPAVHYNLGILYDEDLGMPSKAREHYSAFLELAPEDKDAGQVYEWLTALE